MPAHGLLTRPVLIYVPTTQAAYVVNAPAGAATDVFVYVNAGITLSDSLRFSASWPADCSVTLIVDGIIAGAGQAGADAVVSGAGNTPIGTGGHGVFLNQNVRVYVRVRGVGFIAGGGGGGGSGAGGIGTAGSGPGGGGQGYPGGAAGNRIGTFGSAATAGTTTTFGTAGSGAGSNRGSPGGDGAGLAGIGWNASGDSLGNAGGNGGQPGAAIYYAGFPRPIVLEGADSAHLKGSY